MASDPDDNQHIVDGPPLKVIVEEMNVVGWGREPDVVLAIICKLKTQKVCFPDLEKLPAE